MPPFLSPWAAATVALLDGCTDPGLSPGPATDPPRPGARPAPSPLMTSCRSTSLWLSPATTSLPTVCCQFWASGSGSRSDSWPRSSSRRWGRRTSVQNPRLGDSTLLGKTDARLRPDGRRARGVCPRLPVPSDGRDGRARLRHGHRTEGPPRPAHLRPILGVKGGVGFSRDLWGEGQRSVSPRPQLRWAWRPEPRIPGGEAGGGGRGRLVEAGGLGGGVHVHVAAGARHAVCLPGARQLLPALQALGAAQADLGTRAGGGKRPQPVSWPAAPAAISRRLHSAEAPPLRPKRQSFLDGSWFSATPASLSGSPVPGGGRRHRPLTPCEGGCPARAPLLRLPPPSRYLSPSSGSSGKLPVERRCVPGSGPSCWWLFSKCWMMFLTLPGLTGSGQTMTGGCLPQDALPSSPGQGRQPASPAGRGPGARESQAGPSRPLRRCPGHSGPRSLPFCACSSPCTKREGSEVRLLCGDLPAPTFFVTTTLLRNCD